MSLPEQRCVQCIRGGVVLHFLTPRSVRPVVTGDYPALEAVAKMAIKDKQPFQRLVAKKEDLLKMFEVCLLPALPLYSSRTRGQLTG
jgi:threonyl-tRNA synthetase